MTTDWEREIDAGEAPPSAPPPDGPEPPESSPAPGESGEAPRPVQLPLNDYGNGQRVLTYFGEDLMFVPRIGWFVWDGRIWAQDFDGMAVRRKAHRISGLIIREALELSASDRDAAVVAAAEAGEAGRAAILETPAKARTPVQVAELDRLDKLMKKAREIVGRLEEKRGKHLRHAKAAGNSGPISNMLHEAEPYVEKRIEALNLDALSIACESGTLVFVAEDDPDAWRDNDGAALRKRHRVELRPHNRDDMITKMMPVAWDPEADCPVFEEFLRDIQPDAAMREFLQRWFGYGLTGLTSEQKLVFLHGTGRNGKSTLVDLIARMMGEYATSVPIETLTGSEQRKGADATPDLVRIPGARMVRASEPEEGLRFKEAMIKLLTGGEPILIRKMREEFVEIDPVFKLTISGNHKPAVRGADDGIWRRILLVPFDEQIPVDRVDHQLGRKLWAERSGILNWLLAGACAFLDGGLREPESVREATEEFRDDSDPVRRFLVEACEVTGDAEHFVSSRDISTAFRLWGRDNGLNDWTPQTITKRIAEKAGVFRPFPGAPVFSKRRTAAENGYGGVQLTDDFRERVRLARDKDWKGGEP